MNASSTEALSRTVEVGDVPTHVLIAGEGPPLVFLHGTAPAGIWLPFHAHLARDFTVYAPDMPGFGKTPRPDWLNGMDDLVLHCDELFRLLGLVRPALAGFSLGGWLAAELAVYYPDRFSSLVLHNAAGLHIDGDIIPDLCGLSQKQLAEAVFHVPEAAAGFFGRRQELDDRMKAYGALTTLALLAWNPWFDPALARRARRIQAPTLALWAEMDRLIPPSYARAYAEAIPGARVELLPDCGHMAIIERPDAVAASISRFVLSTS